VKRSTVYFDEPGPGNTSETLALAVEAAERRGAGHVVVASNTGATARELLEKRGSAGFEVVCVTHHVGFRGPGKDEMDAGVRRELAERGVKLLTTTHLFSNVERGVMNAFGGIYPAGVIAQTLKLFGEGTKVCVEISVMALDAGLVPHGRVVVAVGGTGRGADTCLVLRPAHSREFFRTQIHEIVCKPGTRWTE